MSYLKKASLLVCLFLLFGWSTVIAQNAIYYHSFDLGPYNTPYTVTPDVHDFFSNSYWTTSSGTFTSYSGVGGIRALAVNSANPATKTLELSMDIAPGYVCNIKSYGFYHRSSSTGYSRWKLMIANIAVDSGDIFVDVLNGSAPMHYTGNISLYHPPEDLTGTVKVDLVLSGGSHGSSATFRLDNFELYGSIGAKVNYERVHIVGTPIINIADTTGLGSQQAVYTKYLDGLGRPIQYVKKYDGSGHDIVWPLQYDNYSRQQKQFLPYAIGGSGNYRVNAVPEQLSYYNTAYPDELGYSYGETVYDNLTLSRSQRQERPGHSYAGSNIGVTSSVLLNKSSDEVRMWNFTGFNTPPVSNTIWDNGMLLVTETTDEANAKKKVYTDKTGKVILSKNQVSNSPGLAHTGWLCTYFVYDDLGRLRQTITPKVIDALNTASNWQITQQAFDNLCYSYEYDKKGRVTQKKIPGAGLQKFVYDDQDRQVLAADGNLSASNHWVFTKYDLQDRPVISGRFLNIGALDQPTLAQEMLNTNTTNSFLQFLQLKTVNNPYTVTTTIPDAEIYGINYYDDYQNTPSGYTYDNTVVQNLMAGPDQVLPKHSLEMCGMPTGSLIRIMDGENVTSDWKSAVMYYDDHSRLLQMQTTNAKGGKDMVSYKYNFKGNLLSTLSTINNPGTNVQGGSTTIAKNCIYDASWRPTNIYQKINDEPYYRMISYKYYDDLSTLAEEGLGTVEDRKYKYTIWGGLQSINKPYYDGSYTENYFGELISYETGFNVSNHLGMPSSLQWRQKGSEETQRAYSYTYDPAKRLTGASYSQKKGLATGFTNTEENYTANNMQYDANGNLLSMDQWGTSAAEPVPFKMDQLTYRYKGDGMTNQLDAVDDQITTDYHLGEFTQALGTTATDYNYDANGNATQDVNKNILSIDYNYQNKPYQISFTGNHTIKFKYDASGQLLNKQILEQGVLKKNIDYISGLEFENDTLVSIPHENGRSRPVTLSAPGNQVTTGYEYDFYIKDHQGNVRSVVTQLPTENWYQENPNPNVFLFEPVTYDPQQSGISGFTTGLHNYIVTNETAQATIEEAFFDNVAATRDIKPNSTNLGDVSATRLNSNEANRKLGPSILLRVMSGDKVQVGSEAYYSTTNSDFSSTLPLDQQIAQAIIALSGAGAGNLAMNEGTMSNLVHRSISGDWASIIPTLSNGISLNVNAPQAFLNCIFLDDNLQIIPGSSQIIQVYGGNQWVNLQGSEITLKNSGYLLVYVNNTSPMDVNFDNISVKHTKGRLLQESHYYPYGLAITSQPYANVTPNNFWYLSSKLHKQEFSDGTGLNWQELGERQYDAQIGRWHSPDLLQEKAANWSPYRYAFDNPVVFTDASGLYEDGDDYYRDDDMRNGEYVVDGEREIYDAEGNNVIILTDGGYDEVGDRITIVSAATEEFGHWESGGDRESQSPDELVDDYDSHYDYGRDDEVNTDGKQKTATDAGHGNLGDPGAIDGKSYEKDYALTIESATNTWLTAFGIDNLRTRTGDTKYAEKFAWRYTAANDHGADVFVSFHLNGGTTSDAVYVVYQQGKSNESGSVSLAQGITSALSDIMNVPANAVATVLSRTRFAHLAVLNNFNGNAGVLVEFGSIQNAANRTFIDQNTSLIGYRVASAMYSYLNNGAAPPVEFQKP